MNFSRLPANYLSEARRANAERAIKGFDSNYSFEEVGVWQRLGRDTLYARCYAGEEVVMTFSVRFLPGTPMIDSAGPIAFPIPIVSAFHSVWPHLLSLMSVDDQRAAKDLVRECRGQLSYIPLETTPWLVLCDLLESYGYVDFRPEVVKAFHLSPSS